MLALNGDHVGWKADRLKDWKAGPPVDWRSGRSRGVSKLKRHQDWRLEGWNIGFWGSTLSQVPPGRDLRMTFNGRTLAMNDLVRWAAACNLPCFRRPGASA